MQLKFHKIVRNTKALRHFVDAPKLHDADVTTNCRSAAMSRGCANIIFSIALLIDIIWVVHVIHLMPQEVSHLLNRNIQTTVDGDFQFFLRLILTFQELENPSQILKGVIVCICI